MVAGEVWFCFPKDVMGGAGVVSRGSFLVLAFREDVGKMGKAAGSMSFAEVVRTAAPISVKGFGKKCVGAYSVSKMETQ